MTTDVSYSYMPKSKVPAIEKNLAFGADPKGVFIPLGEIIVITSPEFTLNLFASFLPKRTVFGFTKLFRVSSVKLILNTSLV